MTEQKPPAVLYIAAWQILLGLIFIYRAYEYNTPLAWVGLSVMGLWHLATAVALYDLKEWARRRAVQLAVFDLFALLSALLPYPYPFGALLKLGMPLYTLLALNDERLRRRFS